MRRIATALCTLVCIALPALAKQDETPEPSIHDQLQAEATALRPMVDSDVARAFLDAVPALPKIETRTIYYDPESKRALRADRATHLSPETLEHSWKKYEFDDRFYYTTWFGTPLAFVRPLDLIAQKTGIESIEGRRVVEFGYGNIGQLRLLASIGANTIGIDVNTRLDELYSFPGDRGAVARADGGRKPGTINLTCGQWPASDEIIREVGAGYDIFISKNTLKRGYIHPERDADPRQLVHLGVSDETFVSCVWDILNPGGVAMIYNICPKRSAPEEPYKPWSDGRCPFDRAVLEKQGFEIIEYNADDTEFVRRMAKALGWDEQMDVEGDLFAEYTLLRKPADQSHPDE